MNKFLLVLSLLALAMPVVSRRRRRRPSTSASTAKNPSITRNPNYNIVGSCHLGEHLCAYDCCYYLWDTRQKCCENKLWSPCCAAYRTYNPYVNQWYNWQQSHTHSNAHSHSIGHAHNHVHQPTVFGTTAQAAY